MSKAEDYRKRVAVLSKRMRPGPTLPKTPLGRKHKALTDMADNEDWLNGKPAPRPRV
jgi:hypothetical protein